MTTKMTVMTVRVVVVTMRGAKPGVQGGSTAGPWPNT